MEPDLGAEEVSSVLAMVDNSARQLCPLEWEDGFSEYAEQVTATSCVPGENLGRMDEGAVGIIDAGVFLGIGLAFLGQVAVHVLWTLTDLGVEKIAESASGRVRAWYRHARGSGNGKDEKPGAAREGGPAELDVGALADEIAARIGPAVATAAPQVTIEVLKTTVRLQLEGLAGTAGRSPRTGPRLRRR